MHERGQGRWLLHQLPRGLVKSPHLPRPPEGHSEVWVTVRDASAGAGSPRPERCGGGRWSGCPGERSGPGENGGPSGCPVRWLGPRALAQACLSALCPGESAGQRGHGVLVTVTPSSPPGVWHEPLPPWPRSFSSCGKRRPPGQRARNSPAAGPGRSFSPSCGFFAKKSILQTQLALAGAAGGGRGSRCGPSRLLWAGSQGKQGRAAWVRVRSPGGCLPALSPAQAAPRTVRPSVLPEAQLASTEPLLGAHPPSRAPGAAPQPPPAASDSSADGAPRSDPPHQHQCWDPHPSHPCPLAAELLTPPGSPFRWVLCYMLCPKQSPRWRRALCALASGSRPSDPEPEPHSVTRYRAVLRGPAGLHHISSAHAHVCTQTPQRSGLSLPRTPVQGYSRSGPGALPAPRPREDPRGGGAPPLLQVPVVPCLLQEASLMPIFARRNVERTFHVYGEKSLHWTKVVFIKEMADLNFWKAGNTGALKPYVPKFPGRCDSTYTWG